MFQSVVTKLLHTRKRADRSSSSFRVDEVDNVDVNLRDGLVGREIRLLVFVSALRHVIAVVDIPLYKK
jgi:hypothetical protein